MSHFNARKRSQGCGAREVEPFPPDTKDLGDLTTEHYVITRYIVAVSAQRGDGYRCGRLVLHPQADAVNRSKTADRSHGS